jgi:hypothetical protein
MNGDARVTFRPKTCECEAVAKQCELFERPGDPHPRGMSAAARSTLRYNASSGYVTRANAHFGMGSGLLSRPGITPKYQKRTRAAITAKIIDTVSTLNDVFELSACLASVGVSVIFPGGSLLAIVFPF